MARIGCEKKSSAVNACQCSPEIIRLSKDRDQRERLSSGRID